MDIGVYLSDPIGKWFLSCFSIFLTISWSLSGVNPSAPVEIVCRKIPLWLHRSVPDKLPLIAASRADTWNYSRNAASPCTSVANGDNDIFASDSDMRIMAPNCLRNNQNIRIFCTVTMHTNMKIKVSHSDRYGSLALWLMFVLSRSITHHDVTILQLVSSLFW